jgi:hypothetical protein
LASSFNTQLASLQTDLQRIKLEAQATEQKQFQGNLTKCTQQFNGCMRSSSVCGDNFINCAPLNHDEITAKKASCDSYLSECGVVIAQDVWKNFLTELDRTRASNLNSTQLSQIAKCDNEIMQCMLSRCKGTNGKYEMCYDSTMRNNFRTSCLDIIDRCQAIGSYGYDKVLSEIQNEQSAYQKSVEDYKGACDAIGGEVINGNCKIAVTLKYSGEILDTKYFDPGSSISCSPSVFGEIKSIQDAKDKAERQRNTWTAVAAGVGAVGGAIGGGIIGNRLSTIKNVADEVMNQTEEENKETDETSNDMATNEEEKATTREERNSNRAIQNSLPRLN